MLAQTLAVTGLNLRSIPQRWGMSLATVASVALVVGVLMGFLAIAAGFRATIDGTGSDDVAVVSRAGSASEVNSVLGRDDLRLIEIAPGVAADAEGAPILSGELYVIADGVRRATGREANLSLRGVSPGAERLRPGFTLVEGRLPAPGAAELAVGEGVLREFTGFAFGETVRLGPSEWTVVGVFSTGGTVFDSELWADVGVVQNLYQRGSSIQTIRVALQTDEAGDASDALAALQAYAEDEPRLNVDIVSERAFFAQSAGGTSDLIMFLGWPLAILMAVGALAGAWNAMYASVDARVREIATLRAIGFSGLPAFVGVMTESLLLALAGGLLGAFATFLIFDGVSASTLAGGFSQVVFSFAVTPQAVVNGVGLALAVGLFGGLFPAIRAARTPLLSVHAG